MYLVDNEEVYYGEPESDCEQVKVAKMKELSNWRENDVYSEVEWDDKKKLISTRWVVTEKEKDDGKKWKARLVARGFSEQFSEGCESPTSTPEGIKLVLATIIRNGWRLKSLDVAAAYLQGRAIERELYLRPPKEIKSEKIWKLKKAVYGLKDAAKTWYQSLLKILYMTGGEKSSVDPTI